MLNSVISSKTKISILKKLFLNPSTRAYLRELASEFSVSTNSIRTELNNLTRNNLLISEKEGRNVFYRANPEHPLFPELSSMVRKITGITYLAESVIERLGNLEAAYLTGDYAQGKDTGVIDLILIGDIDKVQLDDVIMKSERYIKRKIRPLVLTQGEYDGLRDRGNFRNCTMLWRREEK